MNKSNSTNKSTSGSKSTSSSSSSSSRSSSMSGSGSSTSFSASSCGSLNDEQIIKDILSSEKSLAKLYMDAILESSCPVMRETLGDVHMDVADKQFECFKYMEKRNLYPVEYAENQQLKSSIQKFSSLQS